MELKQIKELMAAMGRTGTKKLVLKKGAFELQLEREDNGSIRQTEFVDYEDASLRAADYHRRGIAPLPRSAEFTPANPVTPPAAKEEAGNFITSPIVGTYYSAPSPDEPTFVKVGDQVDKNTVVCIIEAMKVMNEIKAGVSGTVAQVYLENGQPVEFGTKLIRIV